MTTNNTVLAESLVGLGFHKQDGKPQPVDSVRAAGEVLVTTAIGDVMKALGRNPKAHPLDSLDIWDDEDRAMFKKVWRGV